MQSLGWQVKNGMFIKKFPLGIKFIKWQRPEKIDQVKQKTMIIKVEPDALKNDLVKERKLKALGFRKDKSPMLPTKTIWIDLKKNAKQLLSEMHYKTRYNIKKHRQKVEIIRGDKVTDQKLRDFFEIYRKNAQNQKFWGLSLTDLKSLFACMGKKAYLLKTDEAGLVILVHDKVAYYSHNAATKKGKQKFEPTSLTWEAIRLAKKLNCVRFDFEGIKDERYKMTKKWAGFSRFKKGFGGEVVEYLGSFTKINFLDVFQKIGISGIKRGIYGS